MPLRRLQDADARDASGADGVGVDVAERTRPGRAAPVGEQRERVAALAQLARQRFRREHVAAGAAGDQHDGMTMGEVLGRHGHISPRPTRLRVSASTKPMVMAMPISDEPP